MPFAPVEINDPEAWMGEALDYLLDYLTANADEWEEAYGIPFEEGRVRAIAKGLIAALRIQENQP
jgi:hypothetical protein